MGKKQIEELKTEDFARLLDFVQSRIAERESRSPDDSDSTDGITLTKVAPLSSVLANVLGASEKNVANQLLNFRIVSIRNRSFVDELNVIVRDDKASAIDRFDKAKPAHLYVEKIIKPRAIEGEAVNLSQAWDDALRLEGVPEHLRDGLKVKLRAEVARALRPKWADRLDHRDLRTLTAPEFLKLVYQSDISDGVVDKDQVRSVDPALMGAVESYISQREGRGAGLGHADGLTFRTSKPPNSKRGRPRGVQEPT